MSASFEFDQGELENEFAKLESEDEFGRRRFSRGGGKPPRQFRPAQFRPGPFRPRPGFRRPRRRRPIIQTGRADLWSTYGRPADFDATPSGGSEQVRWTQSCLNQILGLRLPITGVMDTATRSAVRSFQKQQGLRVDGIVGPPTESAIAASCGQSATPSDDAPPSDNAPPPDAGELAGETWELEAEWQGEVNRSSREYKLWVQASLNRLLGARLALDGIIGRQTRSAIRSFQQRQGLVPDGIVGPNTEAALIAAGAGQPPSGSSTPRPSANRAVDTPLPSSGPGYYSYKSQAQQYGLAATIRALQTISAAWQRAHPQGPRIGFGDISLRGGGPMSGHASHQLGVDVDVRLMRNDGRETGTVYQAAEYSRPLTQELINLIRANGVLPVRYIFFNDPAATGVSKWPNHDNHLHVRFSAPTGTAGESEIGNLAQRGSTGGAGGCGCSCPNCRPGRPCAACRTARGW